MQARSKGYTHTYLSYHRPLPYSSSGVKKLDGAGEIPIKIKVIQLYVGNVITINNVLIIHVLTFIESRLPNSMLHAA